MVLTRQCRVNFNYQTFKLCLLSSIPRSLPYRENIIQTSLSMLRKCIIGTIWCLSHSQTFFPSLSLGDRLFCSLVFLNIDSWRCISYCWRSKYVGSTFTSSVIGEALCKFCTFLVSIFVRREYLASPSNGVTTQALYANLMRMIPAGKFSQHLFFSYHILRLCFISFRS